MGFSFFAISSFLIAAVTAGLAAYRPALAGERESQTTAARRDGRKRFSPKNTLFVFAPSVRHPAGRLQRRLLKPALPALIRDDVAVVEVYGDETPRRNGELMKWLDASLLRHAMGAEEGFQVLFVDSCGKTLFKRAAPMVGADILDRLRAGARRRARGRRPGRSLVLQDLKAA